MSQNRGRIRSTETDRHTDRQREICGHDSLSVLLGVHISGRLRLKEVVWDYEPSVVLSFSSHKSIRYKQ